MKWAALFSLNFVLAFFGCARISDSTADIPTVSTETQPTQLVTPIPIPKPDQTPENTSLADKSPEYLCDHLIDLKRIPWDPNDFSGDAVYDALKRKGYSSMPCLVDKITDTRAAEWPSNAPFWAGLTYRVGDTAVFMLMSINDIFWPRGMLPKKYEDMFETEGMFAYYFYVDEVPGARKDVQRWWRNWLKTCNPECKRVDLLE